MDGKIIPIKAGDNNEPKPCAGVVGTSIVVEDLFYNMSTRRQAFKNTSDEYQRILDVITKYSIQYSNHNQNKSTGSYSSSSYSHNRQGVSFICKKHGQSVPDLHTQSTASLIDNISISYGSTVAKELIDFCYEYNHHQLHPNHSDSKRDDSSIDYNNSTGGNSIDGSINMSWIGKVSNANYSTRKAIYIFFINNRLVECPSIRKIIESVYCDVLPRHGHPFVYLSIM